MTVTPEDYQPRLAWYGHAWRLLVAAAVSAMGIGSSLYEGQYPESPWWVIIDITVGVLCLLLVLGRRRWPVTVALITNAATAVSFTAGGPALLALVSLCTRRRWREIVPITVVALVAALAVYFVFDLGDDENFSVWAGSTVFMLAIAVSIGLYIGSRRELLATLRERAHRAEAEQAARVEQAQLAERARIAREMHDVLAHRISIVSMHAGALAYRDDLDPGEMREALEVIRDGSHQALVELREVLGVLRADPGDAEPSRPQPTACDIEELIAESGRSGLRIAWSSSVNLDEIPASTGRTVFRIVQEVVTNVAKHAPQTQATIRLTGGTENGLAIRASNPFPVGVRQTAVPPSGLGLFGLRERLALSGGTLTVDVTPSHEFVVHAWLPWRP